MNEKRWLIMIVGVLPALAATRAYPSEFRAFIQDTVEYYPYLGEINGWDDFALSDDGQVIVGYARTDAPGIYEAFQWTLTGGVKWLLFPSPPALQSWGCKAAAVSGNGSKIFLNCNLADTGGSAPYLFEGGTFTELPRPGKPDLNWAYVHDTTPSGDVAVGYGIGSRAIRWSAGTYMELGRPDAGDCDIGDDDHAMADLVSDDGSMIAGYTGLFSPGDWGMYRQYARLVVWRQSGFELERLDMLGYECGNAITNNLNDISGDGSIVVGGHPVPAGDYPYQPVWWNTATGDATVLPLITGSGHTAGVAYCTNRDGSLIGGSSGGNRGVIWDRASGGPPTPVERVLQDAGLAPDIMGWQLTTVYKMSWDGKQLAGHGIAPDGKLWNWWADLRPAPPNNDLCVNAKNITPNHTMVPFHIFTNTFEVAGSTTEASSDAPHSCASSFEPSVNTWYKYTAPVNGYLYLDLCDTGSSLLNPFIAVHTGCPANGSNEVICRTDCHESDDCDRPCVMPPSLSLTGGQTYYIQVGGGADEAGHPITLKHRFLPINDDCDDAVQIVDVPSTTPGSTVRMGIDSGAVCNFQVPDGSGVWYTVMGLGTTMTASTCGLADFDTKISIFCGGCGRMACIDSNDDACGGSQSSISWCAERGMVYHILVHGDQLDAGPFQLDIAHNRQRCTPTFNCHPANEICEEAFPIAAGTTYADNTGANISTIGASCVPSSGHDVWYSYTTRCDGELWVDTCQVDEGSMVDSVVSIYDDCSGAELACNDDYSDSTIDCGLRSAAIAEVGQDQDVRIRVAGYGTPGYEGSFPLRVTEVPAPLIMPSYPLPDAFTDEPYELQLEFWGSCGQRRISADGLPPGLSVNTLTGVISGTPLVAGHYVINVEVCDQIYPDGQCASGEVFLRVWPSNDDCAHAMPVTEGHYYFSNIGATTDGPDEPEACDYAGYTHVESDVWYRYTSSCHGIATVDACEVGYDSKLAIYPHGECPTAPAAWLCNDDECGGLGSLAVFPVETGREYLLRVGGFAGDQGRGEMLITCFNDCNINEQSDTEEILSGAAPDCNGNLRPDDCDLRGDYSDDGVINLLDLSSWINCMTGPCGTRPCQPPLYSDPCCGWIDFNHDGDVDLREFAVLQRAFGGGLDLSECAPTPDGQSCEDVFCAGTQHCAPTAIHVNSNDNPAAHRIIGCECRRSDVCHVEIAGPGMVRCAGGCQEGDCTLHAIGQGEGTVRYSCECTP